MEFKNYPKRKPSTVMDRQSMDKIQLGILQKKLEAKVKDHGIRVFTCEILPGGVVNMGYTCTVSDQSVITICPQEARQSLKAKEKLERNIQVLKKKIESHSETQPTSNDHPTTTPPFEPTNPINHPTNPINHPAKPTNQSFTQMSHKTFEYTTFLSFDYSKSSPA